MKANRNRRSKEEVEGKNPDGPKSMSMKKKKKNARRLGGAGGLSLMTFANIKTNSNQYNPSLIKKQKEFYKNAKYVSKFKKKLKKARQQNDFFSAVKALEDENEAGEGSQMNNRNKKKKKSSLRAVYEQQLEKKEKAKMEREAIIKAKREEREKAEACRKAEKEKMYKRTGRGQPVMKYRIEHLLNSLQGSN